MKKLIILISMILLIALGVWISVGCCAQCCGCEKDKDLDASKASAENIPSYQPQVSAPSTPSVPPCNPTPELPDGKDNNCNGQIDEEVCGDGIDNNGNGNVDESPPC
jgi:hypothetical protein